MAFAMVLTSIDPTHAHEMSGVKLYVFVPMTSVVIVAGYHVPVIPLEDDAGKSGGVLLRHTGSKALKVGLTLEKIVTSMEELSAH